jgi:hypothetical protein
VRISDEEETQETIRQITDILCERRRIRPGQAEDFHIQNLTEIANALKPVGE